MPPPPLSEDHVGIALRGGVILLLNCPRWLWVSRGPERPDFTWKLTASEILEVPRLQKCRDPVLNHSGWVTPPSQSCKMTFLTPKRPIFGSFFELDKSFLPTLENDGFVEKCRLCPTDGELGGQVTRSEMFEIPRLQKCRYPVLNHSGWVTPPSQRL